MFYTWIRYRDADGNQFDLREDATVPDGDTPVKGYPEYVGMQGRPGKAAVDLREEDRVGYSSMRKAELLAEVDLRNAANAAAGLHPAIDAGNRPTIADLVGVLEAHDAFIAEGDTQVSDDPSVAGEPNTNEAGTPGEEE